MIAQFTLKLDPKLNEPTAKQNQNATDVWMDRNGETTHTLSIYYLIKPLPPSLSVI